MIYPQISQITQMERKNLTLRLKDRQAEKFFLASFASWREIS